ncbi:Transcriptional repressor NF-X1 [Agyrium rufum]|nr:Transcriptional repressor NF-X1 [Agyrium rufum]
MEGTEVASSANAENHPATRSRGRRLRAGLRPGDGHIRNTSSGNGTPASIPSQANRALAFRPASVAPSSGSSITQQPSSQLHSSRGGLRGAGSSLRQNESTGRGRGGTRAGRGQRRGVTAEANGQAHMSGRTFGGQLTSETTETDAVPPMASQLQADAPDFQPGQSQHSHRANTRRGRGQKRPQNGPVPRLRRGSSAKSNAPDIATRIHEDIESGVYECPICTAEIVPNSRIWVDQSCWTVETVKRKPLFHDSGDVRAAIFPKTVSLPPIHVGVAKKQTRSQYLAYRLTLAVRPAIEDIYCRKNVTTVANYFATLDLVHHVGGWVPCKAVSVESNRCHGSALRRITIQDGVAERYVAI